MPSYEHKNGITGNYWILLANYWTQLGKSMKLTKMADIILKIAVILKNSVLHNHF